MDTSQFNMEFLRKRVLFYGKKSSIHGLRYLVDENNSYLIKIFWLIPIILSSIGSTYIFIRSYEAYVYNSISFVTETTYLNWNTSFPAVSICEVWYKNKYWERLDKYNLTSKSTLQEYLSETVFFTGQCYTCDKLRDCPDCDRYLNLTQNLKEFRFKCEEIFVKCLWNNEPFNCCDQFLPLETEYGICYTINSLHTRPTVPKLSMISNRFIGPGRLQLATTLDNLMVSLHSQEDVPFINQDPILKELIGFGKSIQLLFSVNEISNDKGVRSVVPEHRGCLYPDEIPNGLRVYNYYSYSTCVVQCRVDNSIKLCNCTQHLIPKIYQEKYCTVPQLTCLTNYYETLNSIRENSHKTKSLHCDCPPSCEEPAYNIVLKSIRTIEDKNDIRFDIKMQSLPTEKFKRNVVRDKLELVVSIGGTLGLFFGASVLSIAELFYFFCIRKYDKEFVKKKHLIQVQSKKIKK